MMKELNQSVIREVKNSYYTNCNSNHLSNRDLLILILEPIIRDRSISILVDQMIEKGLSNLTTLSELELSMTFDLDEKQSFHLMSVFELTRRLFASHESKLDPICTPVAAVEACRDLEHLDKEHFVVLFLNTKNHIVGRETISIGTVNAALVHPREVFKAAIRRSSSSIIAVHNHPSGDTTPSPQDIDITKRLVEAGELIGIEVLDHIIIGKNRNYCSLKEKGHMGGEPVANEDPQSADNGV